MEGRLSEWNEGNYKSLRLHEIQEMINYYRINPVQRDGNKFHYELWFKAIELLRGEGAQKYSDKEKIIADGIRELCKLHLKNYPPHSMLMISTIQGQRATYKLNQLYYDVLIDYIEKYEDVVKDFNDKHGLGTKNRQEGGMF